MKYLTLVILSATLHYTIFSFEFIDVTRYFVPSNLKGSNQSFAFQLREKKLVEQVVSTKRSALRKVNRPKKSVQKTVTEIKENAFSQYKEQYKSSQQNKSFLYKLEEYLHKFKRYPKLSRRRGEEGVVSIRFQVDPQGKMLDLKLSSPSGYQRLDTEALRLVKEALAEIERLEIGPSKTQTFERKIQFRL